MEASSALWFQLLLMLSGIMIIYGCLEFYRRYYFVACYIILLFTICLLPFAFGGHPIFFSIKWLVLCTVWLLMVFWRIAYVQLNEDDDIMWRKVLYIPAEYLFNTENNKFTNTAIKPPSKCMEWFLFLLMFSGILVAVLTGIAAVGEITNSITGIILAFTIPLPAKILYGQHGYAIKNDDHHIYDILTLGISREFIIAFLLWDFCLIWHYTPELVLLAPLHLFPALIRSCLKQQYDLYVMHRMFTIIIVLWLITPNPSNPGIVSWILDGSQFQFIMNISKKWIVFEIWGSINLIFALIHLYKWYKWIKNNRQHEIENNDLNNIPQKDKEII